MKTSIITRVFMPRFSSNTCFCTDLDGSKTAMDKICDHIFDGMDGSKTSFGREARLFDVNNDGLDEVVKATSKQAHQMRAGDAPKPAMPSSAVSSRPAARNDTATARPPDNLQPAGILRALG